MQGEVLAEDGKSVAEWVRRRSGWRTGAIGRDVQAQTQTSAKGCAAQVIAGQANGRTDDRTRVVAK